MAEKPLEHSVGPGDDSHYGTGDAVDRAAGLLEIAVGWAEMAVGLILAVVILVAVVIVGIETFRLVAEFASVGPHDAVSEVVKAVLDTFIIIELFRITIAYVRHHEVIPTVLETALVVAAREIVVIEAGASDPLAAAAVAGTLLSVGLTWFLLRRDFASGAQDHR